MHLSLSEEQKIVIEMARDFMKDKFPREVLNRIDEGELGYSPEIWNDMTELGWTGLAIPEEYGGAGMSFLELAFLLEEIGKVRPISPFFSTVVLGGLPILENGSDEQKQLFLPKIASGESIFTLALTEDTARYDASGVRLKAIENGDGYTLNGIKLFVPDAHVADHLLCVARTGDGPSSEDGITVFIVETNSPGIICTPYRAMNNDRLCEVVFNEARVSNKNILGRLGEGWKLVQRIMDQAAVAKCCEMVGGAAKVLEMTVRHATDRKQFNHPIGSFQAVQHHCANILSDVDSSKLITYEAAWRISEGLPHSIEAAMAKGWVSDAYRRVVALGHQVHGGSGLIDEHDMPLYFNGAKVAELAFGDARFHRKKLAHLLEYA